MRPVNLQSKPTIHRWLAPLVIFASATALLLVTFLLR